MSQIHIQVSSIHRDEGVLCKRRGIRGRLTLENVKKLINSENLRTTTKSKVFHTCGYRRNGQCYEGAHGNQDRGEIKTSINCLRSTRPVTALCKDCLRRIRH